MRKIGTLILLSFFLSFSGSFAQDQAKAIEFLKSASKTERIQFWSQLCSGLNKMCPMTVDSETIIINTAPQENGLTYNYQLVKSQYDDLTVEGWKGLISDLAKDSIARFCSSPDSLFMREANAQIRVIYFDRNGKYIREINFNAGDDC